MVRPPPGSGLSGAQAEFETMRGLCEFVRTFHRLVAAFEVLDLAKLGERLVEGGLGVIELAAQFAA